MGTEKTKSKMVSKLGYDGNQILLSDEQIELQESKDNAQLESQKEKLENLQRQKPPSDPEELVKYLIERLDAAEEAIKVQEKVIISERELRKMGSKYLKAQNKELLSKVEKERKNLSDKVSAELDETLKQAVKEKVEIKMQLDT